MTRLLKLQYAHCSDLVVLGFSIVGFLLLQIEAVLVRPTLSPPPQDLDSVLPARPKVVELTPQIRNTWGHLTALRKLNGLTPRFYFFFHATILTL